MNIYEKIKAGEYNNELDTGFGQKDKVLRKEMRRLYNEETARLNHRFYLDLCEDLGEKDCPAIKVVFNKAWEDGHSNGYSEVLWHFEDLLDFIEEVKNAH